jgi:hypothetical protein
LSRLNIVVLRAGNNWLEKVSISALHSTDSSIQYFTFLRLYLISEELN